ncbi:hypothetical protein EYF80_019035 [Liparis tanakae]|uniref:Uncharacterized protein n=1 Tax=Liparis tanakae TaxID=230148 RepID=A0A4Z2I0J0_9TELE|nr:hypothetical protein EYF80_019035 [Liparis tanakae]
MEPHPRDTESRETCGHVSSAGQYMSVDGTRVNYRQDSLRRKRERWLTPMNGSNALSWMGPSSTLGSSTLGSSTLGSSTLCSSNQINSNSSSTPPPSILSSRPPSSKVPQEACRSPPRREIYYTGEKKRLVGRSVSWEARKVTKKENISE